MTTQIFLSMVFVLFIFSCENENLILDVGKYKLEKNYHFVELSLTNNSKKDLFFNVTDLSYSFFRENSIGNEQLDLAEYLGPNLGFDEYFRHLYKHKKFESETTDKLITENLVLMDNKIMYKEYIIDYLKRHFRAYVRLPQGETYTAFIDLGDIVKEGITEFEICYEYIPSGLDLSGKEYKIMLPENIDGYKYLDMALENKCKRLRIE